MNTIKRELEKLIYKKGYTETHIADKLGVTQAAINNWLYEKNGIDIDNVLKLNDVFNLNVKIKECPRCKKQYVLNDSNFYRNKTKSSGYQCYCKKCSDKIRLNSKPKSKPKPKLEIQTKICSKCMVKKSVDEFNKNKSKVSGLQSWCKDCQKKYNDSLDKIKNKDNNKIKNNSKSKYIKINKKDNIFKRIYKAIFLGK